MNAHRHPKGVSTGGQFAPATHAETDVRLGFEDGPVCEECGVSHRDDRTVVVRDIGILCETCSDQSVDPDRSPSEPDEDDLDFARKTLGPTATAEEIYALAEPRLDRDEPERNRPEHGPRVGRGGWHDTNWGQDVVLADWEASPGFVVIHDQMPMGTPAEWTGAHLTSANGTRWNVRAVPSGAGHGRHPNYSLTAERDMVIFYDADDATVDQPHGQMVASYYLDTLDPRGSGQGTRQGLDLYGGVPAWKMDAESLRGVLGWARMSLAE